MVNTRIIWCIVVVMAVVTANPTWIQAQDKHALAGPKDNRWTPTREQMERVGRGLIQLNVQEDKAVTVGKLLQEKANVRTPRWWMVWLELLEQGGSSTQVMSLPLVTLETREALLVVDRADSFEFVGAEESTRISKAALSHMTDYPTPLGWIASARP